MKALADRFLGEIEAPDGLILKYASISCGPREVKMYVNEKRGAASTTDTRDVRWSVAEKFPHCAIEVEGRLKNFDIRQHLLTRLSALGRFRHVYARGRMRELGCIVSNPSKRLISKVLSDCARGLLLAWVKAARRTSVINVLMYGFGFVSDELNPGGKAFFLDSLGQCRNRRVPLSVAMSIMRSWIVRFDVVYLADQLYFKLLPQELVGALDSGKGRTLK